MAHWFLGGAIAMIGLGMAVPAMVASNEQGHFSLLMAIVLALATILLASSVGVGAFGGRTSRGRRVPPSVMAALVVNAVFLGLLTLEVSHGLVRQDGVIAKSLFFLPPALVLFWGLLTGRAWARQVARWGSLGFALLFFGVTTAVCTLRPTDEHGSVWVWIACVSIVLGSLMTGGFLALGQVSARRYFTVTPGETA